MEVAFGVKDEPLFSGERADQNGSVEEGGIQPAFRSTDDLRGPMDDCARCARLRRKRARSFRSTRLLCVKCRFGSRFWTRISTSRRIAIPFTTSNRASRSPRAFSRSWSVTERAHAREHGTLHHGHRGRAGDLLVHPRRIQPAGAASETR